MKKFEHLNFIEIMTKEKRQEIWGAWATDTKQIENQEHAIMFFDLPNNYHNGYGISVLTNIIHSDYVAPYECALLIGTPKKSIVLTPYIKSCETKEQVSEYMEMIQKLQSLDTIFGDFELEDKITNCVI